MYFFVMQARGWGGEDQEIMKYTWHLAMTFASAQE